MDKIYVFPHSKSRLLLNITHISVVKTGCFEFKLLNIVFYHYKYFLTSSTEISNAILNPALIVLNL